MHYMTYAKYLTAYIATARVHGWVTTGRAAFEGLKSYAAFWETLSATLSEAFAVEGGSTCTK